MRASANPFDATPVILAGVGISAIGALFYNVLPVYLGAAQDYRSLDNRQLGLLTTAFFCGYNLVTLSAFFWIRRWNWRRVAAVAMPLAALGLYAGTRMSSFTQMLLVTAVAGGGFSALYGIGTTVIADTSNPARWYGVKIAAEAAPGIVLLYLLPGTLISVHGFDGAVLGLLLAMLLMAPLVAGLPAAGRVDLDTAESLAELERAAAHLNPVQIWAALAGLMLFFTAASSVWAFLDRIGVALGFEVEAVGALLAATLVAATAGSLLTAALGDRFGNRLPYHLGSALLLLSLAVLAGTGGFVPYAAAACLFAFCFALCLPFAVAEIARLDADGRYVILSVPAIGIGAMVGPGLAGLLSGDGGYGPVLGMAAGLMILSNLFLNRSGRDTAPERAPVVAPEAGEP